VTEVLRRGTAIPLETGKYLEDQIKWQEESKQKAICLEIAPTSAFMGALLDESLTFQQSVYPGEELVEPKKFDGVFCDLMWGRLDFKWDHMR
jgi:hypothetical protein